MIQNILKLFVEKGFLLDREMLEFFSELKDEDLAKEIVNKISLISKEKIITKNLLINNINLLKPVLYDLDNEKKRLFDKFFVNVSISFEVKRECFVEEEKKEQTLPKSSVKILSSPVTASQKIEVKDFVKHFRSRYNFLKSILQEKVELDNLTSINKITSNRNFSIIGIVNSKSVTKNNNIILEVEDLSGQIKILINQTKEEIYKKAKEIILDDIVGFKCSGSRDFVFANDIFYPECYLKEKKRISEDVYAIFISDIHVGSKNFLKDNFERFLSWINGEGMSEEQRQIIKRIRYMFIVGDSIDGVGIYPGQEKDLEIKDIKKQYEILGEYLERIPKYISIIHCPGQHDAVRVAEPQPPVGSDFAAPLHKLDNIYLVSNPSFVEIASVGEKEGFKILMYHGASMHGVMDEIEELRICKASRNPPKIVKHLLKRRHLAPIHGSNTYIPDNQGDPLLIKEIPDVVVTGDLHRTDIDMYNNILLISSSCWQSMTAFEEKVGNIPDPCKVPVLNLKTREIKILDFTDEEDEKECKENESEFVCETKDKKQENLEVKT
ncbi:MAG: DNA-directed DNA polymerase II small subunit [Candidatus Nanoarchaeia archaeon]